MTPKRKLKLSDRFWLWWHDICPKHFEVRSHWVNGKPEAPYMDNYRFDILCPVCRREDEERRRKKRLEKAAKERRVAERLKTFRLEHEIMNGIGMCILLVFMFVVVTLL